MDVAGEQNLAVALTRPWLGRELLYVLYYGLSAQDIPPILAQKLRVKFTPRTAAVLRGATEMFLAPPTCPVCAGRQVVQIGEKTADCTACTDGRRTPDGSKACGIEDWSSMDRSLFGDALRELEVSLEKALHKYRVLSGLPY